MSRTQKYVLLAAALTMGATGAAGMAYAQDAAPAAAQAATPPPATPSQPAAAPSGGTPAAASGSGTSSKPAPVCFKLTGRCVEGAKASTATKGGTPGTAKDGAAKRSLNLAAPDVRTVVPEGELKEPLPNTDQVEEVQEARTVSVKTESVVPPEVPGGFGALWWALNHPSQAWRILTPAE